MNSEEGDFVPFETQDPKWTTVKLQNGVVLQVRLEVTGVIFIGYQDPVTGQSTNFPIFSIQTQQIVRNQHLPRELIQKKIVQEKKKEGSMYG